MIKTPTVFVLGAGASMPYGFPSGLALRKEICGGAINRETYLTTEILNNFNVDVTHINDFASAFLRSNISSIDAFLARRSEYVEVGKYAIAIRLCARENPTEFDINIDDHWYFALWNALISNVSNLSEFQSNCVKVLTFNYDRSLEYFLFSSIKHTFGVSDEEAYNALKFIPISHVYGSLGDFGVSGRPYIHTNEKAALSAAAKGIRIIPEARDDDEIFDLGRSWFSEAHHICFLGFGFDELNVKRLGLNRVIEERNIQGRNTPNTVIASCYEMTQSEQDIAGGLLGAKKLSWQPSDTKNLQTLRRHAWILR